MTGEPPLVPARLVRGARGAVVAPHHLATQAGLAVLAIAGLFVLAGATPAAIGLLADVTEAYPDDRGAIMGLYSVFLGLGQIIGSLTGGIAAEQWGLDGIFVVALVMLAIALGPLAQLRHFEHFVAPGRPVTMTDAG